MPYVVVTANGQKVRPVSSHESRTGAIKSMHSISGTVAAVLNPAGKVVASNVRRSF